MPLVRQQSVARHRLDQVGREDDGGVQRSLDEEVERREDHTVGVEVEHGLALVGEHPLEDPWLQRRRQLRDVVVQRHRSKFGRRQPELGCSEHFERLSMTHSSERIIDEERGERSVGMMTSKRVGEHTNPRQVVAGRNGARDDRSARVEATRDHDAAAS